MKTTHTHKGHCQVCGNIQAVDNSHNLLAKHGYSVDYGYFNGVCTGADNLPIELDRTIADKTIIRINNYIKETQTNIANIENWFPATVYRYELDGESTECSYSKYRVSPLTTKELTDGRVTKTQIEMNMQEFAEICVLSYNAEYDYYADDLVEIVGGFRKTKLRKLNNTLDELNGHLDFLALMIEKFYGKPLTDSMMVSKAVEELTSIACVAIVNEQPTIEIKTAWDGREHKVQRLYVWESEAEKEVNGKILKVVCLRNKTWRKFTAYTYLDGKKVGRKVLEEMLGA